MQRARRYGFTTERSLRRIFSSLSVVSLSIILNTSTTCCLVSLVSHRSTFSILFTLLARNIGSTKERSKYGRFYISFDQALREHGVHLIMHNGDMRQSLYLVAELFITEARCGNFFQIVKILCKNLWLDMS